MIFSISLSLLLSFLLHFPEDILSSWAMLRNDYCTQHWSTVSSVSGSPGYRKKLEGSSPVIADGGNNEEDDGGEGV
jgi:hypothetical protein